MKTYRFYKEEGFWFIDLKYFPLNKAWLTMVAGADELLEILSEGKDEVKLVIDTNPFPYSDGWLERDISLGVLHGATYDAKGINITHKFHKDSKESQLWLCPATLWVFLKYPKKIYYKVDHTEVEDRQRKKTWNFTWLYGREGKLADLRLA
jgi:hypothetical protein